MTFCFNANFGLAFLSVLISNIGHAEMIKHLFPPSPEPGFYPNFTGYDFDNIDWYKAYEAMSQSPHDAIISVSTVRT